MDRLYERDVPRVIRKLLDIYGELTTSEVIEHIDEVYTPTVIDLEPIPNRNDTKYTQTIRNLALHKKEQLKNGDIAFPEGVILSMDDTKNKDKYKYTLATVGTDSKVNTPLNSKQLEERRKKGKKFTGKKVNFEDIHTKNSKLGLLGEQFVLSLELNKAEELGLSEMVIHTSQDEGDGTGYDIASIDENGKPIFIEVKTTKGSEETPFYMSENELNFFNIYQDEVFLYRVFNFDKTNKTGELKVYEAKEILSNFNFKPNGYKVSKK
ncbi:hypothetical protein BUZ54_08080 [Staphylococcus hominis]|uniref:DUF3883 domain-containing protein n=1 Tax=Staphylococcus hominis TaxID=1290 RepID=UPI000D1F86ED|nr:DUF3883 domain-containing protein [Staphylococcus hominis]PTK24929.1 hypothetical protein BUZ54_08080 [Staphylococcus hominis]